MVIGKIAAQHYALVRGWVTGKEETKLTPHMNLTASKGLFTRKADFRIRLAYFTKYKNNYIL
jgi:hypothetical protein